MGGGKKMERKRIRDFGIVPGVMKTGPKNKITDVPGVLVGHKTVRNGDNKTGGVFGNSYLGCSLQVILITS